MQAAIALIERDGAGWVLRDDSGAHWHADRVIVAVPAPQVARLIGDIAPRTAGGRPGFGGFGGGAGAQGSQCDAISGSVGSWWPPAKVCTPKPSRCPVGNGARGVMLNFFACHSAGSGTRWPARFPTTN